MRSARDENTLQGIDPSEISEISFEQATVISRQNAVSCSNSDVASLAINNLAQAIKDALVPIAEGRSESVHSKDLMMVESAMDGVAAKFAERITTDQGTPTRFKVIFMPQLIGLMNNAVSVAAGDSPVYEHTTMKHLQELKRAFEQVLDDAAPVFVDLEQLPADSWSPFSIDPSAISIRFAQLGEILESVSLIDGHLLFHDAQPAEEGQAVGVVYGKEYALLGQTLQLFSSSMGSTELVGVLGANATGKNLAYEVREGEYQILHADCWFAQLLGTTFFVNDDLAESILQGAFRK